MVEKCTRRKGENIVHKCTRREGDNMVEKVQGEKEII
jgi:hypothetical protein